MHSKRSFIFRASAACVGLATLSACGGGSVGAQLPAAADESDYRLSSGDRVRITVFGEESLSGEYELDGVSSFSMPLVGTISAQDSTVRELETTIAETLSAGYVRDPRVSVEVLNYRPFYIFGEVNTPGSYPYRSGLSLINAVAVAGGFTYRASEDNVIISRDGVDYAAGSTQTRIQPGDVIRVNERFF